MLSNLNEKNERTEKVIHLLVTTLCNRNCKYCCNKQYNINDVPTVTDGELRNAETICITSGEPFEFSNPCSIAFHLKRKYKNIKNVYVYTNALEFASFLQRSSSMFIGIDGINVSIKNKADADAFRDIINPCYRVNILKSNLLYVFDNLYDEFDENGHSQVGTFKYVKREWQPEFVPADDSIFRRI